MRVRAGQARRRSKKRLFKEASGRRAGRGNMLRTMKETLIRARVFAYRDRRVKKREFRALWITRVSAACRERGISYAAFIHGLKLAQIELNRKTLSELAIFSPAIFDEIVEVARKSLSNASAA